jgi:hypothetical protein
VLRLESALDHARQSLEKSNVHATNPDVAAALRAIKAADTPSSGEQLVEMNSQLHTLKKKVTFFFSLLFYIN